MRILFLKTEPETADRCVRELAQVGFDAGREMADSPEQLAALLDRDNYDLVLTEYAAPGWNWRAALEALRGRPELVPLVVLAPERVSIPELMTVLPV